LIWVEVAGACYPITVDPAVIAAPVITSISFDTSPVVPGTSDGLTIIGSNFGASGLVQACPSDGSNNPCVQSTPTVWSTGTINIGWNSPGLVAGVAYCVNVAVNRFDGTGTLPIICALAFYVPAAAPTVSLVVKDGNNNSVTPATISWPVGVKSQITLANGSPLDPTKCLHISADPAMPKLTAQLQNSDGSQLSGPVVWQLAVTFPKATAYDYNAQQMTLAPVTVTYPQICGYPPPLNGTATYSPDWCGAGGTLPQYFSGGQATVTATYKNVPYSFPFCISGTNPKQPAVDTWFASNRAFWFEDNVAIHETFQSQFCDADTTRTGGGIYCGSDSSKVGMPIYGPPGGYGILQTDPAPDMNSIWSWKGNIAAWETQWAQVFDSNYASPTDGNQQAYAFWVRQAYQWAAYNIENGNWPTSSPAEQSDPGPGPFGSYVNGVFVPTPQQPFNPTPLPPMPVSFVTNLNPNTLVSQQYDGPIMNEYWYGDAVLMKQLAGTASTCSPNGPQYVSWNNTIKGVAPQWSFQKASLWSADIVYEFSTCSTLSSCVRHTMGPCNQ
jgi:hypothetical protein